MNCRCYESSVKNVIKLNPNPASARSPRPLAAPPHGLLTAAGPRQGSLSPPAPLSPSAWHQADFWVPTDRKPLRARSAQPPRGPPAAARGQHPRPRPAGPRPEEASLSPCGTAGQVPMRRTEPWGWGTGRPRRSPSCSAPHSSQWRLRLLPEARPVPTTRYGA